MDDETKERLVGYTRVSTPKQAKGHSIELQKDSIERYCKVFDFDLIKIYKDEGLSAYRDRPAYERMIQRVFEEEYIDGVIVNDLTRFGRSTIDLLVQVNRLGEAGKKFISIKDNIDISTKNGRLLLTMLSAIADYERETIMERMEAGKERAKMEGTKSGKPMHRPKAVIDWDTVKDLRKVGLSWTKTAKQVGVSVPTLIKRAREEGCYN